ncbi:MAG: hypothetical protein HPY83_11495 [Anaerolineae bacterium]|nr:hypothetical protein [Anaerolineae bacterium]
MTQNVLRVPLELAYTFGGALILIIFAVAVAIPHRIGALPGSRGHRDIEDESEEVRPDSYIDSFAGEIEEAGGGLPLIVRIALPGIILWWLAYLVIYWTPR